MKNLIKCGVVLAIASTLLVACNNNEDSGKIKITDCSGVEVEIKKDVKRVISVNQSFVAFMIAMGEGNKVIGTHGSVLGHAYLPLFSEDVLKASKVGYQANPELIYSLNPDLVVLNDATYAQTLRDIGLPAIYFGYDNINELYKGLDLMGDIFGDNAKNYVTKWKNKVDSTISTISSEVSSLKDSEKKDVYYINAAVNPGDLYTTFGGGSFVEYWINSIGGKLATSNYRDITSLDSEIALSLNPSNIFISGYAEYTRKDELMSDPLWTNIKAVKNNDVYLMPTSLVSYERFSVELPMLLEYSANILYPELHEFKGIETLRTFFNDFYGLTFTDEVLNNMLLGLAPDGTKMG